VTGARAMILAAGRGERMRPLTDTCPKPLLEVRGKPLLQYHLEALARAGLRDVVINSAWLGQQIEDRFPPDCEGLRIRHSTEGKDFGGALETAGGIARALPLLADTFWLVAGDVYAPKFEFSRTALERFGAGDKLAHVFLVPNPAQHPKGDFALRADGIVLRDGPTRFTYSTIGIYRKAFFSSLPAGNPQGVKAPMLPLLLAAIDQEQLTAEVYPGPWADVGTPGRLAELNTQ
jgi:N-acetyl-alpha-D-muramate 1-phosphate uridylyltransferase